MNGLRLAASAPAVLAGTATWAGAWLVLRQRRQAPVAIVAAPLLVGAIAVVLLDDMGSGNADSFAAAWIIAPGVVIAAAALAARPRPMLSWGLVACGLALQLIGLFDGGPYIAVRLPGLGDVLTADLARLALIMAVAAVAGPAAARTGVAQARADRSLVALGACWAASVALSLAGRDLGQAFISIVVAVVIVHTLALPVRRYGPAVGAVGLILASGVLLLPHARDRLEQFTALGRDQRLDQGELALFATASGGLFGVGLGQGGQAVIGSTAAQDWLLAVDARVFGFLGVVCVLGALTAAGSAGLRLAANAQSGPQRLAATGAGAWMLAQVVVASAGVFGVIPETGLAPPFFGAGRVPLLVFAALSGIAASAAPDPAPKASPKSKAGRL